MKNIVDRDVYFMSGLDDDELDKALDKLITLGLVEVVIEDGEVKYKVTSMGVQTYEHSLSDTSSQN